MKVLFRGTHAAPVATRFLTAHFTPTQYLNRADGVRGRARKLFFELVEDVAEANTQGFGHANCCQNSRNAFMAFNKADCRTRDSSLFSHSLMRQTLLLTQPRKLIDNLFYQNF